MPVPDEPVIRLEIDVFNARYPVVIDPFIQQQKLEPGDLTNGTYYGRSVALNAVLKCVKVQKT